MGVLTKGCVFVFLACSSCLAQYSGGVNIDFNSATGPGAAAPTNVYGGAAGQFGFWNAVNGPYTTGVARTIRNLANTADAVTLVVESASSTESFTFNNAQTAGDAERLFDDIHNLGVGAGQATYSIGPFAGGVYEVYTYAIAPDSSAATMAVSVYTSSTGLGAGAPVGGTIPAGGATAEGVTHSVHRVAVARGERIYINARTVDLEGSVNGIQIKRLGSVTRLYVGAGSGGEEAGLSWEHPCRSLQRALSVAGDTPSVSEIWVKAGAIHRSDEVIYSAGDPNATFNLRSGLTIRGYFRGDEASPDDRPTSGFTATLLSGNYTGRSVVTATGVTNAGLDKVNLGRVNDTAGGSRGCGLRATASTVNLTGIRFQQLTTSGSGAGVAVLGGSTVTIDGCDTIGLRAAGGSFALIEAGSSLTLQRATISTNVATSFTSGLIDLRGSLTMANCLLANNTNPSWLIDGSAGTAFSMINCTVANNRSTVTSNVGLALPSNTVIRNSIVWGNQGVGASPFGSVISISGVTSTTSVSDSTFQSWDGSLNGPEYLNNATDPRFTSPEPVGAPASPFEPVFYLGYRLASRSPARDSGWNTPAESIGLDIADRPRIYDDTSVANTGFAGGTVDRGCWEAQDPSEPCPGDLGRAGGLPGNDGLLDNNDFIAFINFFFALDPRADVGVSGGFAGSDGLFDNNDFIAFIDLFFGGCP